MDESKLYEYNLWLVTQLSQSDCPVVPVEAETEAGPRTDQGPHPVQPVPGGHHPLHPGLPLLSGRRPVHQDLVGGVDGDGGPGKHEQHAQRGVQKEMPVA